jgi:hypothetical protein
MVQDVWLFAVADQPVVHETWRGTSAVPFGMSAQQKGNLNRHRIF